MSVLLKVARRLLSHQKGNVSILFGLAIPVLLGVTALGIDAATINHQKDWMQNTSDEVSLAVAKELRLYRDKTDQLKAVGVDRAEALISVSSDAGHEHVDVVVDEPNQAITVKLSMVAKAFIPGKSGARTRSRYLPSRLFMAT